MTTTVFCLDFDETLMNTDRLRADLLEAIRRLGKEELAATYQEAYETTREEHGVPRIPLVLKTMSDRYNLGPRTHRQLADIFHDFPYQDYLYEGAEAVIAHLKQFGKVLIVSDGDAFFQPEKIHATTAGKLVDGIVVLTNKTDHFDDLSGYYPADKYVFIDDKQKVLDAAKNYFGDAATTVLVKQGRYAITDSLASADMNVLKIKEVMSLALNG